MARTPTTPQVSVMTDFERYLESDQAVKDCADWIREHADELATSPTVRALWEFDDAADAFDEWLER